MPAAERMDVIVGEARHSERLLRGRGFPLPDWRGDATLAMLSVQLVNVWRGTPFFAIGLLAGMQAIPEELYEAARLDGARPVTQFWRVTWPLLIPSRPMA